MKRKLMLITALCMGLCACSPKEDPSREKITITNDVLFNCREADLSNYKYLQEETADFEEISFHEALRFFTEQGSGILYFGYDTCYWCNRAIPELNSVAMEYGVTVYYVDTAGTIILEDVDKLLPYLEETFVTNKEGKREFFVPEVLGIKKGEIVGSHVSLVKSFTATGEEDQMTDDEKAELREIYREIILAAAD